MNHPERKRLYQSVILAVLAFVLAQVLGFLGMALAGAGHGSDVLGFLFLSPVFITHNDHYITLGPYLLASVGALLPWVSKTQIKLVIIILIGFCYWGAAEDISADVHENGTTFFCRSNFSKDASHSHSTYCCVHFDSSIRFLEDCRSG